MNRQSDYLEEFGGNGHPSCLQLGRNGNIRLGKPQRIWRGRLIPEGSCYDDPGKKFCPDIDFPGVGSVGEDSSGMGKMRDVRDY